MRIGVLGAARIVPKALLVPAADTAGVVVAAVAARDRRRAGAFASEHGIATVHEDYSALVSDESLDAVYVALPASLHAQWSIAALEAGRHVLVEKPFASNADEAREMVEVARRTGRHLVEAFHWRYHPIAARMIEVGGRIGPLSRVDAEFSTDIHDRSDIRYQPELGGGALMDLGCYAIHWVRTLVGEEPVVERANAVEEPPGIDEVLVADLRFPSGVDARVRTSMRDGQELVAFLTAEGEHGTMTVDNPITPHTGNRLRATFEDGGTIDEEVTGRTTYHYQLEAFVDLLEHGGTPLTGGADAVGNMATIDAAYRAAGMEPRNERHLG
ncbi:MAG TPA: Gfo/Idh/MocA family oxidoreductase [Acidimicrobiales bacterium]|nr:Gfo/Idh/MocA family oxidoreductase [Acidimicrobiales bacterium]